MSRNGVGAVTRSHRPPGVDSALLAPDEPPAFEQVNPAGRSNAVLVCDHACNRVPRALMDLGLGSEQLAGHIAWDPGAAEVARGLSRRLDAPLVLGNWSRLVIDLNRPLASPESIPEQSDGVCVPGNLGLTREACARRVAALFDPYHRAVAALLDARVARRTMLFGIHSFTPALGGMQRPWQAGVAYGPDRRLAESLLRSLVRHPGLCIGDNQPYDLDPVYDYTLPAHGAGRGMPHAMIEIRQDQLADAAGVDAWVERLADAFARGEANDIGPRP